MKNKTEHERYNLHITLFSSKELEISYHCQSLIPIETFIQVHIIIFAGVDCQTQ